MKSWKLIVIRFCLNWEYLTSEIWWGEFVTSCNWLNCLFTSVSYFYTPTLEKRGACCFAKVGRSFCPSFRQSVDQMLCANFENYRRHHPYWFWVQYVKDQGHKGHFKTITWFPLNILWTTYLRALIFYLLIVCRYVTSIDIKFIRWQWLLL